MLDPSLVRKARDSELEFINKLKVWDIVPRPPKNSGELIIKGRWVDINKGDESVPNYRSRYVGKEIKKGSKSSFIAEFFAAMPPLQGCKFLLLLALCDAVPDLDGNLHQVEEQLVVGFLDVKRAHFMSAARRKFTWNCPLSW